MQLRLLTAEELLPAVLSTLLSGEKIRMLSTPRYLGLISLRRTISPSIWMVSHCPADISTLKSYPMRFSAGYHRIARC